MHAPTKDYAIAAKRLLDYLGYEWKLGNNTGGARRRWLLRGPGSEWGVGKGSTSQHVLGQLIFVATSLHGFAMTYKQVKDIVQLDMHWMHIDEGSWGNR